MGIKDLILRLRIKDDNKLSKRKGNSFGALKENFMEQAVKSHNKNQKKKFVMMRKRFVKKFNNKCFIYDKTKHLAKDCRNKS